MANATSPTTFDQIAPTFNDFLMGICFEACTMALFSSGKRILDILAESKRPPFLPSLIFLFNLAAMMNIFVLYKSYVVTGRNRIYGVVATVAFLYRIGWTIADLILTGGSWDPVAQACNYNYNGLTGFHYTIADIACDLVATAGSVAMFLKPANSLLSFQSMWFQLVKENVLRSVVTMLINPFVMYMNLTCKDYLVMNVVYTVQNYTYVRMMNLEILFKDLRDEVYNESKVPKINLFNGSKKALNSLQSANQSGNSRTDRTSDTVAVGAKNRYSVNSFNSASHNGATSNAGAAKVTCYCEKCSKAVGAMDNFCRNCGHAISQRVAGPR
ncbi:hypothetical protein HDU98_001340 [Podochytrium sp. JEL0797]|nr:hypothetical protein HDU98_001340 [Podochytrium sp. JEL0797]